jgi:hypothetical protein
MLMMGAVLGMALMAILDGSGGEGGERGRTRVRCASESKHVSQSQEPKFLDGQGKKNRRWKNRLGDILTGPYLME